MKKLYALLTALTIFIHAYAQLGLTPSTLGQVYNLSQGDTFEYSNYEGYVQGAALYSGYDILVIDSVVKNVNWYYYYSDTRLTVYSSQGGYGTSPEPIDYSSNDSTIIYGPGYFIITAPDSSIFSIYSYPGYDTSYITPNYNERKEDNYSFVGGEYAIDETYVEGIGLTKRSICSCGNNDEVNLSLVYYHKASGEQWGTYTIYPLSGVDKITEPAMSAKIFPNPITDEFELSLSEMPAQKLYLNVFDVMGKKVRQEEVHSASSIYSRSNLSPGAYVWQIASDYQVYERGVMVCK